MTTLELPLISLFIHLRQHGFPLGLEEYILLVRALQAGFGIESRSDLEKLCCMLWTKSPAEARLLHRLLEPTALPPSTHGRDADLPEDSHHPSQTGASSLSDSSFWLISTPDLDDPVQIAQGKWHILHSKAPPEYFPVTHRQMKQNWRHLRRPHREGPLEELDIEATVDKASRQGILLDPVLVPRRINRAELVLIIDQDGSMVPFHSLVRQLVETAKRGGQLGQTGVYYFHDYPDKYLYHNPARTEAESIPTVLAALGNYTAVLIVSDAGAARGNLDLDRVQGTRKFLQDLRMSARRYAWFNPLPEERWLDTSAGHIAQHVPMFEMSRLGLDAAIDVLRGRHVHWERTFL